MKIREIAEFLSGELLGDGDADINSVADINDASSGQIAFLEKGSTIPDTNASCVILGERLESRSSAILPTILVADSKLSFARIAKLLHPAKTTRGEINSNASVAASARLGKAVSIGQLASVGIDSQIGDGTQIDAGAMIGKRVRIGSNCVIHSNVSVEEGSTIGDNVILHAGVVIGADGFGYVRETDGTYIKFPQIGTVVIEDNVEIGANTCVDRGALGETRIGEGTKIDNLVQIAHNVQIGKRVVIAAQTGISGSVVIEDDCVIGGQVGIGDHARVQSGAVIGSQAGVLPGKIVRPGIWWGTPVQPLDEYKRQNAHVKGLERLKSQVRELKSELKSLNAQSEPE